ncbi:MAG: UDP-N-acetylmuramoyl-L-alanine--D-glutamate ligase [Acidocella sp. 20-57-95]|nr:MAG: UDP-N-acetylmuramoyl-L-alanine--D-glutamate ligase [Acidocella sp. 20-57-95]OYV60633.1 MAG: UDP-N-acetylmuramoyl-L-alanine--D-glutamate ligase [Acidocella sp. 21-58-7]HQT63362.1 UDP-N-acetylmuramoyl-L-alanine--D-glutamate ligase [Acidocella sp.]HQU03213.1 UDP-N-acetylmuramoyl-L-alanine--D-glutamate ligase [Acidocella sp.]
MNYAPVFQGKRFAVLGLGKAGLPAAHALRAMAAEIYVWDDFAPSRDAAAGFETVRPHDVPGKLDALILSPGIPHHLPTPHPEAAWAIGQNIPIWTDAELLYQAVRGSGSKAKFAGITGTNGKSTTTALLAHILDVAGIPHAAGANLGPAALSLPLLPDNGVYVLEMSSYMLERLASLRFDVAIMLNLSPDHLDRHGDMAGYAVAKRHIFARQDADCTAIIGMDDPESRSMAQWLRTQPAKLVEISGANFTVGDAVALPGQHNAQNAAAATAAARALGVPESAIFKGIQSYPGLPHRQALIAEGGGVRFINDSKATNADAASRAMGCYDRFIWIAGGVAKAGGIESLHPLFPRITKALLIGQDGQNFAATLSQYGVFNDVVGTLEDAVPMAYQAARATGTDVVLLSPAAASFDQFKSFEHRGERFTELVKATI